MNQMSDNSVDFTLTDIPYDGVTKNGSERAKYKGQLRSLNKGVADVMQFDIQQFLAEIYRVTSNSICVFCGWGQFSQITEFFVNQKGTTRTIIWEKSNPSPMNGQLIYLSGIEMAVWFKKAGAKTFNAHCKNTVFKYPCGRSKLHPTEKNHSLLKDLLMDNTNEGDVVFDPCAGSGAHCLVAAENGRRYLGCELDPIYCKIAAKRIQDIIPLECSSGLLG